MYDATSNDYPTMYKEYIASINDLINYYKRKKDYKGMDLHIKEYKLFLNLIFP